MTAFGQTGQALPLFEADDKPTTTTTTATRADRRLRVVPAERVLVTAPPASPPPPASWRKMLPWTLWMGLILGGFVWQFVDAAMAFVRR
jgi:hypothetical protein